MTTTTTTPAKAHPFEISGMGHGPYQWVGTHDIAEAREHAENHGGTAFAQHPQLTAGLGTCCHCGMAINLVCIVRSADGRLWGVGSNCVERTGDAHLGNAAKIAVAQRRRIKAAAAAAQRHAAQQAAWAARPSSHSAALPGETNGAFTARRDAEAAAKRAAEEAAAQTIRAARLAQFGDIPAELINAGGFYADMAEALLRGPLSPRQADCTAKFFARRGSKQHEALCDFFTA
jgi:hypothetical protein